MLVKDSSFHGQSLTLIVSHLHPFNVHLREIMAAKPPGSEVEKLIRSSSKGVYKQALLLVEMGVLQAACLLSGKRIFIRETCSKTANLSFKSPLFKTPYVGVPHLTFPLK